MKDNIEYVYKNSIDKNYTHEADKFVANILKNNTTEFDYISLSIRNHRLNIATSIPSNKEVVKDYIKHELILIDPLACFEQFTTKKILTFTELKSYKNHGKCGKSYMEIRKKSDLLNGFHYIHRHEEWSFTIVYGSSFKKNGFSNEDHLMIKNSQWLNSNIKKSLIFLENQKNILINNKINLIHG